MQLSLLEEPFQCAPSAVGAERSSEDPPQVSTRPSVQELQGALSLGNGKIIKQVTSGTCFSEATSGRDNSVSVSGGPGFPGLATGLCSVWLIGRCWDELCLLTSPSQKQPLPLSRAPHTSPSQQGPLASAGAGVGGQEPPGWPWRPDCPGLGQGHREGHGVIQLLGSCARALRQRWELRKKLRSEKAENFSLESVYSENTLKQPFFLSLSFFTRSCLGTSAQAPWAQAMVGRFPRAMQVTHMWLRSGFMALHWV